MPRTPLSDLQGTNTLTEKLARFVKNLYSIFLHFILKLRPHRATDLARQRSRLFLRDGFSGCNVRSVRERISSFSSSHEDEGIFVNSVNNKLLERAQGILM